MRMGLNALSQCESVEFKQVYSQIPRNDLPDDTNRLVSRVGQL